MEKYTIGCSVAPVFFETIIDGVLPEDKDLQINPKMGYVIVDEQTGHLSLKIEVKNFHYTLLKTFAAITDIEYVINIESDKKLVDMKSQEFFQLFCQIMLSQVNKTIDVLNANIKDLANGDIAQRQLHQIEPPARALIFVGRMN